MSESKTIQTKNVAVTSDQVHTVRHGLGHRYAIVASVATAAVELFGNSVKEMALQVGTAPGIHDAIQAASTIFRNGLHSATDPQHLAAAATKALAVGAIVEVADRTLLGIDAEGAIRRSNGHRHSIFLDTASGLVKSPYRIGRGAYRAASWINRQFASSDTSDTSGTGGPDAATRALIERWRAISEQQPADNPDRPTEISQRKDDEPKPS